MNKKPTHDICIAESYKTAEGKDKSYFTNVGSAWLKVSGVITCEIRQGLALNGRFVITLKREHKN